MNKKDYVPVSCDMHSELELTIMHGQQIQCHWQDAFEEKRATISPVDIITRNSEEFLSARVFDQLIEIRLDRIFSYKNI